MEREQRPPDDAIDENKWERLLAASEGKKWYHRTWVIIFGILAIGPLALPLVWSRPRTSLFWKTFISIVVFIVTAWTLVATADYYKLMMEHYKELAKVLNESYK